MSIEFRAQDCGCYVDGTFGEDHLLAILADFMDGLGADKSLVRDLTKSLYPEIVDNAINEAIDILQSHTEEDLTWIMEASDLILTTEN